MDDLKQWYLKKPLVTRTYLTCVMVAFLFNKFNIISYISLFFWPEKLQSFQLWRLITDYFVVFSPRTPTILLLFIVYFAFSKVEELFSGQQLADLLYLFVFLIFLIDTIALLFGYNILYMCLTIALIYIWCKRKPFETVTFYFGIKVQSAYFPWVLMGLHFLNDDESIYKDLVGMAAGHIYIVLKDFLPITHNIRILETPKFLQKIKIKLIKSTKFVNRFILPYTEYAKNRQRRNEQQQQAQRPPQFFGGRGQVIG